jgi:hypothetical protein
MKIRLPTPDDAARKRASIVRNYLAEHAHEVKNAKGLRRWLAKARLYWCALRRANKELKDDAGKLYWRNT